MEETLGAWCTSLFRQKLVRSVGKSQLKVETGLLPSRLVRPFGWISAIHSAITLVLRKIQVVIDWKNAEV